MGSPSSGCAPSLSPTPLPKGASHHRQSLSISSLPLDKLGRLNFEKRTSMSAVSSPAKVALTDTEKLTIAAFLGHGQHKHQELTRRSTDELHHRKTIGFNPFRGHTRVGSGSFTTTPCKSASECSPRSCISLSSSKKLDKYAVAKIAASLFHSPAKLERSKSLPRGAHRAEVAKKGHHGPSLSMGDVTLPENTRELSQVTQSTDEAKRTSSSDSEVGIEESASLQMSTTSSTQQNVIDITEMVEGKDEGEADQIKPAVEDPHQNIADVAHTADEEDPAPEVVTSRSPSPNFCMTSTETRLQLPSTEGSPPQEPPLTMRKRRRSVSASGIGAMLLKTVRVSDSAHMVTRRIPRAASPDLLLFKAEPLPATKHEFKDPVQVSSAPSTPAHQTESEDAIKSTYSKFVDIEIDAGGRCIELVHHVKDGSGSEEASTLETRSSPRHLHHHASINCTTHGNVDTRIKDSPSASSTEEAQERARISPSQLHSLQDCVKTSDQVPVNSRTILSRLQAPTPSTTSRTDVVPASTTVLATTASSSSSHQDKLWEEQAECYSSGGRGTPGREDPPPPVIINLRSTAWPGYEGGKARGRRGASPDAGHFMQQIMLRIRGAQSPHRISVAKPGMEKRRHAWSSCICFSVK